MATTQEIIEARVTRIWATVTVAGAIALVLLGVRGLRGEESFVPEGAGVPVPIEPEGELPEPPTTFRWNAGRGDAVTQVAIHSRTYEAIWTSVPFQGSGELEIEIPSDVWAELGASQTLYWRVREAVNGKPWGSSRYVPFWFQLDVDGYGPGQNPRLSVTAE